MAKKLNGYELHPVDKADKLLEEKRTARGSTKDKTSPNSKGCPGNDNKEHVYTHILEICTYDSGRPEYRYSYWGPCIGCNKKSATFGRSKPRGEPDKIIRHHYVRSMFERPIKKEK